MRSEYTMMGNTIDQKYSRLDISVKSKSGRLFDIEVQIDKDAVNERGLVYGVRYMLDEFEPGTIYDKFNSVRVISLCNFHVRKRSKEIVEPVYMMYGKPPVEKATEVFTMYHIQLPEFRKKHKTLESVKNDLLFTWLYMLDKGYKDKEEMEELSGMTEGLMNFANQYNMAINDPELLRRVRMIDDARRDKATRISVAETRAADRKNRENAKSMKALGLESAIISQVTGLSGAEIAKL